MMTNRLSRFLRRGRPPVRRAPERSLRLERLEGRDAPAGIVTASLSSGILTLTGLDNTSNFSLNNQSLTVTGTGSNSVSVTVLDGTQFKGTTNTTLNFSGVTGL